MSSLEWEEAARDELADIWVAATPAERADIEQVVIAAERDLKNDPLDVGESRYDNVRVLIRDPLTFWYDVSPSGDHVRIVHVHRHKRSP